MSNDCRFITANNVSLLVGDLLALDRRVFQPQLISWSERLYGSLIDSMKEQAKLTGYTRTQQGLWSASYAAALEDNLSWQAVTAQGLYKIMKPEAATELTDSWQKRKLIALPRPALLS